MQSFALCVSLLSLITLYYLYALLTLLALPLPRRKILTPIQRGMTRGRKKNGELQKSAIALVTIRLQVVVCFVLFF